jgi:hypothetical protein
MLARKHPELKEAVSCVRKMSLGEQWRSVLAWRQNQKMALWGQKEYIRLHPEEARAEALAEVRAEAMQKATPKALQRTNSQSPAK